MSKDTEQIARIMAGLKCSEAETKKIWEADKAIDKGEKLFEQTAEQKAVERKMKNAGTRKPTAYKFSKRERKANPTKGGIIAELGNFLGNGSEFAVENVTIVNAERQISFQIGEETFELTLVQKRKPKK